MKVPNARIKSRRCPICGYLRSKVLYVQQFSGYFSHKIACCLNCGFVFVNNTPSQTFYNSYYRDMSIYEHERDHNVHGKAREIINVHCDKNAKILDVGCSTGHLLYLLKKSDFKNLEGIDPSPECSNIAKIKFNVNVITSDLFSFKTQKKYDLIILSSVLEHLQLVEDGLQKVRKLLSPNGQVIIIVPDAGNFYKKLKEPFGEFSIEHINFFSEDSLYYLMRNFNCSFIKSLDGAIYSVWKSGGELKKSMQKYIAESNSKLHHIDRKISGLSGKVVVWGAGSLTQRLLQTTNLKHKAIKLVDINTNLVGKKLSGIEIISPNKLPNYYEPILVCSYRFKDEIVQEIKDRKLKNKIITL